MLVKEFKKWLNEKYSNSKTTVNNRLANCSKIEKHYGDLDTHFEKDKCEKIIEELVYSTEDEKNNFKSKHKIPIDGNIRTGSATLKQAIRLYVEFRLLYDDFLKFDKSQSEVKSRQPACNEMIEKISEILKKFKYEAKKHKDRGLLQIELKDYLEKSINNFNWEMEYKHSTTHKDSVDIFGCSKENDLKIIIEIDAHRADQVSKKFISRTSLFSEENVLYVSLCYPGTKSMSKDECTKYFNYCCNISNFITINTKFTKCYIGLYLN